MTIEPTTPFSPSRPALARLSACVLASARTARPGRLRCGVAVRDRAILPEAADVMP